MKKVASASPSQVIDNETGEIIEEGTALTTTVASGLPAEFADYAGYIEDSGAGFENQTAEDTTIPFLIFLQPGSPEVQGEDAIGRAGMILNRATGEVYSGKEGISFIPALTEHLMVEWKPKDNGGGFVAAHAIDSELAIKVRREQPLGKYKHPNGNELVETYYVYGIGITADGAGFPAVLAFASTHIKPYQNWMFRARSIVITLPNGQKITKLPLFSHAYTVKTEKQEKNGHTWFIPTVAFAGASAAESRVKPGSDLYELAKGVHQAISTGARRASTESLKREGGDDAAPSKGDTGAADAPY